ncbi:MAG: hypothetical protein E7158_00540 [Firmicutes bacterium]|nr:hypothetical protein [Bacillota bacterium]
MNVPKIRFSEFTSEYKKYKFKDVATLYRGSSPRPIINFITKSDDGVNWIKIGDVNENDTYINKTSEKITVEGSKKSRKVYKNDIILSNSMSFGRPYILNIDGCIHDGWFVVRDYNEKLVQKYLYHFMSSPVIQKQYKKLSAGGVVSNISSDLVYSVDINIPSKEEQIKVSNFLSLIDKKIELQSKKIEDLKLFKKGLIHQMKKNSNNWSEYKISEIFKITRGVVIPKTDLLDNKTTKYQYPVYSSQTSNNGILGYDTKYDFDGKYLTWTTDGANAGKVFYRNGKFRCTNVCGVLYNDNNKYVDELTAELLNYETPKHVSYVGNPKLMNNVMGDIKIFLPDSNESHRVSNILLVINNKVLLETDKLNKLNKLKKGLMQNMFV